ncbi:MAG: hypothetical protein KDA60_19915, partial [Planctomycetales bacterium]|nr:hypothetical protein [Planctomycetales bacterium]
ALAATELSAQLDPDHLAAAENVATIINNWALQQYRAGDLHASLRVLRLGRERGVDNRLLSANEALVLRRLRNM